jgi:hypothetical protein
MGQLEIDVTGLFCQRGSSQKTDLARFGTASGGWYKKSTITF